MMKAKGLLAAAAMLMSLAAGEAGALERWFWIVNESDSRIEYAYATDIDRSGWGRDLIPHATVDPGYRIRVEPWNSRGYCRFDVKLVFANGGEQVINDVNLCEATEVVTYGWTRGTYWHDVRY